MQNRHIVIAVAVLAVLVLAYVFWPEPREAPPIRVDDDQVTQPVPAAEPEPEPERVAPILEPPPEVEPVEPEPILVLPRLNESDEFVRAHTAGAIEMEPVEEWLARDDLVRRFAVVVDNAASGNIPRQQLDFLAPEAPFPVVRENDAIFLDERGYARYDQFVDTVVRIDPGVAAGLIDTLSPLVSQALQELGYRQPSPYARIQAAIDHVLDTPVLEDRIELVQPGVMFEYADPELEGLSPLQKQLVRMGPDNVRRIQSYLQELRTRLPAPTNER
jgi:hypothetical protein